MNTQSRTLLNVLTLAFIGFALPASAMPISNIVRNGGFETGGLPPWSVKGNTGGSTTANTRGSGAFGVDQDSAHTGHFGAFASPRGSLGFLGQDLRTIVGSSYELSFWMDENNEGLSALSDHSVEFEVFWNGSLLFRTFDPPSAYTEFTFTGLLATRSSTDLRFGFRDDSGVFHLDDVVAGISRVPEAFSTFWLALPFLLMLAYGRFAVKSSHLQPGL